jgi:uncharacterized protein YyaL (SSP411 family)
LVQTALATPRAGKSVFSFTPAQVKSGALPEGLRQTLAGLPLDGEPVALVCTGSSCQPPVRSAEELAKTIAAWV